MFWALTLLALCSSAGAQQLAKVPRIGFLSASTLIDPAFLEGLHDLGYVEGAKILSSSTDTPRANLDRHPELAVELVRLKVDLIVAQGTPAGLAVKKATSTIPIVATSGDPVGSGLVASLARPGGNVTGLSILATDLEGKRLEVLKEVVPKVIPRGLPG